MLDKYIKPMRAHEPTYPRLLAVPAYQPVLQITIIFQVNKGRTCMLNCFQLGSGQ